MFNIKIIKSIILLVLAFLYSVFDVFYDTNVNNISIYIFLLILIVGLSAIAGYISKNKSKDSSFGMLYICFLVFFWILFFGGYNISYYIEESNIYNLMPSFIIVLPFASFALGFYFNKICKIKRFFQYKKN